VMARVLVVDDEPDVRLVARLILEAAGFEVSEAPNGEGALAALEAELAPDVVLLDVRMPGVDGWEVLRTVRAGIDGGPPVIVFTADAGARVEMPSDADTEHFIVKPFEPDQLLALVRRALGDA
jgi:CheY-like chemotaxis protein